MDLNLSFDFVKDSTKKDGAAARAPARFEVPADSDDRSQAPTVPLLFKPQGLGSFRRDAH
jgi:hypothetical protein